jgi:hypothetical protein
VAYSTLKVEEVNFLIKSLTSCGLYGVATTGVRASDFEIKNKAISITGRGGL